MNALRGLFAQSSLTVKTLVVLSLVVFGYAAAMLPAVVAQAFFGTNAATLKFIQTILSVGIFLFPPLFSVYIFYPDLSNFNKNTKKANSENLALAALTVLVAVPAVNWLAEWNAHLTLPESLHKVAEWMEAQEAAASQLTEQFLNVGTWGGLAANVLVLAAVPAVCEEFFFRGMLQELFVTRWRRTVCIWTAAALFSAVHLQFAGFFPRMLLGAAFGYLYFWTGSIWTPVAAHFTHNFLAVFSDFLIRKNILPENADKIGGESLPACVVSLAAALALLFFIRRKNRG